MKKGNKAFLFVNLALFLLFSACASPAQTAFAPSQPAVETVSDSLTPPVMFQTPYLNPLDTPRAYIQDTCRYLRYRWNPWNSEPGTVVIIIRFGEVYRGSGAPDGIEVNELKDMMKQLKAQGFEAITTQKLLAFMERNVKIPSRSVLFVRDGNYPLENYQKYFGDYWENWGWSIVNGWISSPDVSDQMWLEHVLLENKGFVDHQAQGVQADTYFTEDSSKVIINREMDGAKKAFSRYFNKSPIAFIWPRGGFGFRPVLAARQIGYQIGITSNMRGPVMYNWVPQANTYDPERPDYLPEGQIGDPLMTLPRYLPREAIQNLDGVRVIGNEAKAFAEANKAAELAYYKAVCEPAYGPIPSP